MEVPGLVAVQSVLLAVSILFASRPPRCISYSLTRCFVSLLTTMMRSSHSGWTTASSPLNIQVIFFDFDGTLTKRGPCRCSEQQPLRIGLLYILACQSLSFIHSSARNGLYSFPAFRVVEDSGDAGLACQQACGVTGEACRTNAGALGRAGCKGGGREASCCANPEKSRAPRFWHFWEETSAGPHDAPCIPYGWHL